MIPVETQHDMTSKVVIGGNYLPAGQTAEQDLDAVLNALMAQPTTAPFISQQLIQHLVTSNPSPAYVQRVSSVFSDNGSGVSGDLTAVITAILMDPEARAGDDLALPPNPDFGHLREPVLFMTNLLRGFNATLGSTSTPYSYANLLGQNLFSPPTVFSYFSPLYTLESGAPAPEFQIYSSQTASSRANVINTAIYGTLDKDTQLDFSQYMAKAGDLASLVDGISYVFLHHSMSSNLQQAATNAANAVTTPLARMQAALYVVLTSGEYQIVQ
jgi:uncharacterized protein (DUF1800 family)